MKPCSPIHRMSGAAFGHRCPWCDSAETDTRELSSASPAVAMKCMACGFEFESLCGPIGECYPADYYVGCSGTYRGEVAVTIASPAQMDSRGRLYCKLQPRDGSRAFMGFLADLAEHDGCPTCGASTAWGEFCEDCAEAKVPKCPVWEDEAGGSDV